MCTGSTCPPPLGVRSAEPASRRYQLLMSSPQQRDFSPRFRFPSTAMASTTHRLWSARRIEAKHRDHITVFNCVKKTLLRQKTVYQSWGKVRCYSTLNFEQLSLCNWNEWFLFLCLSISSSFFFLASLHKFLMTVSLNRLNRLISIVKSSFWATGNS